ncbi:carbohydrate kinase family protein [Fulvimonas sp. R45]|uniref:carbohydrate kinase family protein n=1 Tax=Fulvimonas sp. R45 TaxID=3045937 RepID=UPI00265FC860|nr:carbohydrate kinase family protein [Fulvimonas sp. R45]MDO1530076.1 carbohydrate kinase family protein [Fulvimonas sp. R45]
MKRILVAGELNVDLVFRDCQSFPVPGCEVLAEDARLVPGSSSMICAMGLARLGNPVAFAGKAGADPWGDFCVSALQEAGIDVAAVQRDAALRTGITASFSTRSDRALVTFAGAIGALRADDIGDESLAGADHLHVSSYYLQRALRPDLESLFARARAHGLGTSLDPGFDPEQRWGDAWPSLLSGVDLFLPNDVEFAAISGRASVLDGLRALDNGHTRIVVKRGRQGCVALDDDGRLLESPAFALDAVDSTGAGDSFDAGFLHAWLRGMPLAEAMRWGNACGALSTRGVGGTARQADAGEVRALLEAAP